MPHKKKLTLAVIFFLAGVLLYSWQIEPNLLSIKRIEFNAPLLKNNCTVLFIADLHLPLKQGLEKKLFFFIKNQKPDMILLGGDIAGYRTQPAYVAEELKRIASYGTTVMVRGNTDQCGDRQCIYCFLKYPNNELKHFPATILRNETMLFPTYNIKLFGLDDPITNHNDTLIFKERSDSNVNILLVHSIHKLSEIQKSRFDLILSGHTHGGQIFLLKPFVHLFDNMVDTRYLNGVFPIKKGLMIVTRGLGESFLPLRLGVFPEAIIIKLKKGNP